MNKFLKIETKSYYNFLESALSINDIVNYSIHNNINHAFLIDNNLIGAIEFYNHCINNNIKPIIGINVIVDNKKYILIAKNNLGFIEISQTLSYINLNQYANICLEKLKNTIIISDHIDTIFANNINFYTTISGYNNTIHVEKATSLNTTIKIKYLLSFIKNNTVISEYDWGKLTFDMSECLEYNSYELSDIEKNNYNKIVDSVNLELIFSNNNFIDPIKSNDNNIYFQNLLKNKFKEYIDNHKIDISQKETYINRLQYETSLIIRKKFVNYFLVVSDITSYCNQNDILYGYGRGSAVGSLVSYLLGITKIDPVKNNLIFERFLNESRTSMPDIDLDIMDTRRDEIFDYLSLKYGKNHVAHILTISKFKIKAAIRDVCRVLMYPVAIANKICNSIINPNALCIDDLINNNMFKEIYNQYKQIIDLSLLLVDLPRQFSIHAAGVVLSNEPLYNIYPIELCFDNKILIQSRMEYLDQIGLVKIDLLGLRNLTTIYDIQKQIKELYNVEINLDKINYEDENIFKMLADGQTNGIFQFESPGMTKLIKQIKPTSLEDLAITSSLYRPGASEHIKTFLNNKQDPNNISYIHNDLKPILQSTYGAVIYQEQIINIVEKIANFSKTESENFRKSITKKNMGKLIDLKQHFMESTIQNGYSKEVANKIFDFMMSFVSYGFNRSHAYSYAILSYQLAYLKYYYPYIFYSNLLTTTIDKNKLKNYYLECEKRNILLLPSNLINAYNKYFFKNNTIYMALNSIKGIGVELIKIINKLLVIIEQEFYNQPIRLLSLLYENGITKNQIELLIKSGCVDNEFYNRETLLNNLDLILIDNLTIKDNNQYIFSVNIKNIYPLNLNLYKKWEKELYGLEFSNNEYLYYFNIYSKQYDLSVNIDNLINIFGYVKNVIIKTNSLNKMMRQILIIVNNTQLYLYDFDIIDNIETNKYYIFDIKKFKQQKVENAYIVTKIKGI